MSYITIPSVLLGNERAYKLVSSSLDNWNLRGERCLFDHIMVYQTYGDGTVQHSGEWCAQFHDLEDVCLSFAQAILADPKNPEWEHLRWFMQGFFKPADIRFAFTVKHSETKLRYYSKEDCKVTSADKRNDRRYERVESWADGTGVAAFRLLWRESMDWFTRVRLAVEISAVCDEMTGYWSSANAIFTPLKELGEHWESAYRAFANAVKAAGLLREIEHTLTILAGNRQRCAEIEAEKKAKAETTTDSVTQ